ncbi:cytochrome c [Herbaspirillum autotrophicum]|uniref:cytochrome c n=1 Tax=Herbaspirillum autotrophicum TaxID=180195 RepID=UPI00067CA966|nr:cytochrome c [Herbaspirillum autotrophicum]
MGRNQLLQRCRLVAVTVGLLLAAGTGQAQQAEPVPLPSGGTRAALIEQGRYLAVVGDCMACHTVPKGGAPFAGGYGIASPLGLIYSTNITPSKTSGIGNYTEQQFSRALREGVRADGSHLYPAMPYTSYTLLSDDDVHALYTYFMQAVKPVEVAPPATHLPFPFNIRASMAAWNLLFLDNRRFVADGSQKQEINRGTYLAEGLAHCSACHTPRNALMAEDKKQALGGAALGPWYAPNITSDKVSGIGDWSDNDLRTYLKTGHVRGKSQAAGGMAEAIENSLQYLHDDDVTALVAYLRNTKPIRTATDVKAAHDFGQARSMEASLRGARGPNERHSLDSGAVLYSAYCASCHQASGRGSDNGNYPSLFHNTATGSANPANLVATILYGVERKVGDKEVMMPRFDSMSYLNPLSNDQIAAISNYVLQQYGNPEAKVTAHDVAVAREGGPKPLLAKTQPYMIPVIGIAVLIILLLIAGLLRRRRRRP